MGGKTHRRVAELGGAEWVSLLPPVVRCGSGNLLAKRRSPAYG